MNNNFSVNNNIFSEFPSYTLEKSSDEKKIYYTQPPKVSNSEYKDNVEIKKHKSTKKKIIFGSSVASTILTAGIIGLILAKGMHGSKISILSKKLSNDIKNARLSNTKTLTSKTKFYAKKGTKKAVDVMESMSNFTAIKDSFFDKLCKANKLTKKFCEKITSGFKNIVDKTLGKKYNKAEVKLKDFSSLLKEYNIQDLKALDANAKAQKIKIKDVTKTLGEWIDILEKQTQNLDAVYDKNFSLGARVKRDKIRSKLLEDLPEKIRQRFFKDKGLLKKSSYKNYATEDLSKEAQSALSKQILSAKKELTNNINTITENIKGNINALLDVINPEDSVSMEKIKLLRQKLEIFKKCSGGNEAKARKKVSEEITGILKDILKSVSEKKYSADEIKNIQEILKEASDTVLSANGNSKGALEEIMTILKGLNSSKILSDKSFKQYSKLAKKITKNLEKATELEMGQYFLKQAELKVGSAPTDVLSVLFPIGAGAYAVSKADNKDERISATLTTCIPLVGTFATFVYGTTKMFSGAKNLMFSLVSGAVLGILGDSADRLYKKYKQSGSIQNVVKEEYDKIWTGLETQIQKFEEPEK